MTNPENDVQRTLKEKLEKKTDEGSASAVDLSHYLDYRLYLRDWYEVQVNASRHLRRPYSYAHFSMAANLKSPNYLKMIIDGQRNLSAQGIEQFAEALKISKEDKRQFRALVQFNQEKNVSVRALRLDELAQLRLEQKVKSGELRPEIVEKTSDWILWILFHLLDQKNVSFEPKALMNVIRGELSEDLIRQSLEKLLKSGEVTKDAETGELKRSRQLMENASEIQPELIRKLQSELIQKGLESLHRDSPTEREFGASTLCLTAKEFLDLKFELRKFRKDVQKKIAIARMNEKGDRVFQLNLQLYALTDE